MSLLYRQFLDNCQRKRDIYTRKKFSKLVSVFLFLEKVFTIEHVTKVDNKNNRYWNKKKKQTHVGPVFARWNFTASICSHGNSNVDNETQLTIATDAPRISGGKERRRRKVRSRQEDLPPHERAREVRNEVVVVTRRLIPANICRARI